MNFYFARHGEAVAESVDSSRPLSSAGREDVECVARLAAKKAAQVSVVYHSGILRAAQTAEILAAHVAPGSGTKFLTGLRPEDDPAVAAAELATFASPIMLVGHLPHLARLVSLLIQGNAEGGVVNFVPAMLVCCSRDRSSWKLAWTLAPNRR